MVKSEEEGKVGMVVVVRQGRSFLTAVCMYVHAKREIMHMRTDMMNHKHS